MQLDLSNIDDSIIEQALKQQRNMKNLLKGNVTLSTLPSTSVQGEPPNKKIKKQQNFFSTKKKNRSVEGKMSVSKPSTDQCSLVKSALLGQEFIF